MSQSDSNDWTKCLGYWPEGEVWFRQMIPGELPWGNDSWLDEVPESAKGSYGIKIAETLRLDGEVYSQGQIVTVDSRADFERLLSKVDAFEALIFPWYDRMVPPLLLVPHWDRIDLQSYRSEIQGRFWKALAISIGAVAFGFLNKQFLMLALLAGTLYGLFPLVEATMSWLRRVDRYSVDELNRRTVSGELFRRWLVAQPTGLLKVSIVFLGLIFLGQVFVGINPSVEKAALLKPAVLQHSEWWRTVTTGLMHGGWLHILFNGMALYSLGRVVVALMSPTLLIVVFLLTVITGSLASLYFGAAPLSVGASGGILGCLGFLLVVCEKFKDALPNYLRMSCIQSTIVIALFGLLGSSFIDNAAHAGGFAGGVAFGVILFRKLKLASTEISSQMKVISYLCLAVLAVAAAKVGWELWELYSET